jgi:G3E family GTPase
VNSVSTDDLPVRIPVIVLTGFLGAGKSTLLLRWLTESPATGLRMGVVMNEFGVQSVDGELLNRPGLPLQSVSGGCVCCAPDHELPNAILKLVRSGLCDYIVIETSGLADPDNVIDQLTDTDLQEVVRLHSVVTVLDAEWFTQAGDESGERVLAKKQIQYARWIALSKCDRITAEEVSHVSEHARKINPSARQIRLPFGLPEIGEILSQNSASIAGDADSQPHESRPHLHTTYLSLSWRFRGPVERPAFEAFLTGLNPREVVRAKGFVRFKAPSDKLFVFQSVWGHHFIEEFPARPWPTPVAVLIGPNLDVAKYRLGLEQLVGPSFGIPLNATHKV